MDTLRSVRRLEFWFDYSCPYAYLASTQLEALSARVGTPAVLRPMLLGGVFRARGTAQNLMGELAPAKARHNLADMHRWAEYFGVPLSVPPAHPMRTVEALRATIATSNDPRVMRGFYRAYWVEGRAVSEPETLRAVLAGAGHDADAVLAKIEEPSVKDTLRAQTDEAIALGIFGAPSFVADGELYWGQDRMELIGRTAPIEPSKEGRGTMAHTLEIYWDFSSPYAYLASTQAEALAKRTGATLVWRPMLLGGLFKSIGQVDVPMMSWSDAKRNHTLKDMQRWAAYWGVPFKFPSRFPMSTIKALRAYLALPEERRGAFRERVFRAYWAEDRDINDDAVLAEILGPDAAAVMEKTRDPAVKQALIDATQRAADAGVFGAPTFVIDGKELFWGNDRIPLVEWALTKG